MEADEWRIYDKWPKVNEKSLKITTMTDCVHISLTSTCHILVILKGLFYTSSE
jgi:hypothetical protein